MRYILSRFIQMLVVLSLLSFTVFMLVDLMPGDSVSRLKIENPNLKTKDLIRLAEQKGLLKFIKPGLPDTIKKKSFNTDILKKIATQDEKDLILSAYYISDNNKKYRLKKTLTPKQKSKVEAILKSVQYEPPRELKSPVTRYYYWLKQLFQGNLGFSTIYKLKVTQMIGERLLTTLKLVIPVILLTLLISIPLGVVTAIKQYSKLDYSINFIAFIAFSVPTFVIGLIAIYYFSQKLNIFPPGGLGTPGVTDVLDEVRYLILPILILSFYEVGNWLRYVRGSLLEVLKQDYVRTARAKGLREDEVIIKHAVRNALIPFVTLLALFIPMLFGGALITETIFGLSGMGKLLYDAIINSDADVAMASFLFIALLTLFFNFLADLFYTVVDPRIKINK